MTSDSSQRRKNVSNNGKKRKGSAPQIQPRQTKLTNNPHQHDTFKEIKPQEMVKYGDMNGVIQEFGRNLRQTLIQLKNDNGRSYFRVPLEVLRLNQETSKVVCFLMSQIPDHYRVLPNFDTVSIAMESTSVYLMMGSATDGILTKMEWNFHPSKSEETVSCKINTMYLLESVRSLMPDLTNEMNLQCALLKDCKSGNSISVRCQSGQTKTNFDVKSREQESGGEMETEIALNCVDHGNRQPETRKKFEICHRQVNGDDIEEIFEQSSLEEVNLRDCDVNLDLLQKFLSEARKMKKKETTEIKSLGVTATENIDEFLQTICELMKECKTTELNLEESNGTGKMVKRLRENINKSQIQLRSLNLSYNKAINDFEELGKLLSNRVIELHLVNCDLTPNDIKNLTKLKHGKVQYLDISFNDEIDEESVHNLLALLTNERPVSIVMQGCDLTEDELDGFEKDGDNDDIKIKMLDLSHNQSLESDGVGKVGKIVKVRQTTELRLSSCNLDEDCLELLCDNLKGHELQSLDLSHNAGISSHSEKIVKLLEVSNVRSLNMSDCRMTSSQIDRLVTCLKKNGVKLKEINMSDSERRRIDQKYITAIKKLSEFTEKELILKLPHVSTTERDNLENLQNQSIVVI